jgi:hypothetical protein
MNTKLVLAILFSITAIKVNAQWKTLTDLNGDSFWDITFKKSEGMQRFIIKNITEEKELVYIFFTENKDGSWSNESSGVMYGSCCNGSFYEQGYPQNNKTGRFAIYYLPADQVPAGAVFPTESQIRSRHGNPEELWGFCYAKNNGKNVYVSTPFLFEMKDAQYNFPETKIIKAWRLQLKKVLKEKFKNDYTLIFSCEYECTSGGAIKIHDKIVSEEQRQCLIGQFQKKEREVWRVEFDYRH